MEKSSWSSSAASVNHLDEISQFIERRLNALHITGSDLHDILVAAIEAVTNVMVHGYRNQPGFIELTIERDASSILVHLRDHAPLFNPTRHPTPDTTLPLEKRALGGMGIYLMSQLMSQVHYQPLSPSGNELVLIKNIG